MLLALSAPGVAPAAVFCCDNAEGRQVCADVLPTQCYGRAYRVLNAQGMVIREVAAPLTAEQWRAKREEERRMRAEANKVRAAKLRERALLQTYENISDIDVQEARAIAEVEVDIDKAVKAEEELLKERARLGREKEFYVGKPLPDELKKKLRDNEQDIIGQRSVIEAKRKHIEAIRERYAEDRVAYQEILDRREAIYRR